MFEIKFRLLLLTNTTDEYWIVLVTVFLFSTMASRDREVQNKILLFDFDLIFEIKLCSFSKEVRYLYV